MKHFIFEKWLTGAMGQVSMVEDQRTAWDIAGDLLRTPGRNNEMSWVCVITEYDDGSNLVYDLYLEKDEIRVRNVREEKAWDFRKGHFDITDSLWPAFVDFFREEKGYADWSEEEINGSMNGDDLKEFVLYYQNEK